MVSFHLDAVITRFGWGCKSFDPPHFLNSVGDLLPLCDGPEKHPLFACWLGLLGKLL